MKRILFSLFALIPILSLFSACNSSKPSKNQENSTNSQANEEISQILTVLSQKCIGCGKCIRIDPSHFAQDRASRKAIVISQENISSPLLQRAISSCPRDAIQI